MLEDLGDISCEIKTYKLAPMFHYEGKIQYGKISL